MATLPKVLLVILLGTCCHGALSDTCKDKWEDFTHAVTRGTKEEFVRYVEPLTQMMKVADAGVADEEIPGWKLVQEFKLKEGYGLYGVAYQCESDKSKIVVAFRNLRYSSNMLGGMFNDLCARHYLMSGKKCDKKPLPEFCSVFEEWHIDYLTQARLFEAQLRAVYEEACILYTGQSFGSTLAALMSSDSKGRSLAIGFSSNPSNLGELVENTDIADPDFFNVITIFDKYDSNAALDDDMVGITCHFDDEQPESCVECLADGPFPDVTDLLLDSRYGLGSPCGQCAVATRSYNEFIRHIFSEDTKRPRCYEPGWVEIPGDEKPSSLSEDEIKRRLLDLLKNDMIE